MCRSAFLLMLGLVQFAALHAEPIPVSAPNCQVASPPTASGENANHGVLIKVFPRKSQVSNEYSGCQTMWIQKGNGWEKFSVMYFVTGQLQAWWYADDEAPNGLLCLFSNGKLFAGAPKDCYVPRNLGLTNSFASGCMETAIGTGGISEKCSASLER